MYSGAAKVSLASSGTGRQNGPLPEVGVRDRRSAILPAMSPLTWFPNDVLGWSCTAEQRLPRGPPPEPLPVQARRGLLMFGQTTVLLWVSLD